MVMENLKAAFLQFQTHEKCFGLTTMYFTLYWVARKEKISVWEASQETATKPFYEMLLEWLLCDCWK